MTHLDGCPLARPWLYNLDESIECVCDDLDADRYDGEDPWLEGDR